MIITWNPSDKTAGLTLSNGNLTATKTGATNENIRATAGYATGKYYFEFTSGSSGSPSNDWYGVRDVSQSISSTGLTGLSAGVRRGLSLGQVLRVAVDFDNARIWVAQDSQNWQDNTNNPNPLSNPATNTLPTTTIPGGGTDWRPWWGADNGAGSTGLSITSTFAYPYIYTPPVGFDPFEPIPAPTITSIDPVTGPITGGTVVTLTGTFNGQLSGVEDITFGTESAGYGTYVNPTTYTVTSPAHAVGAVTITMITTAGNGTYNSFTYYDPLTVLSITPETGTTAGGTSVTITGTAFDPAATAAIDGNALEDLVVVNDTTITGTTPAGTAGAKDVTVTNP